MKPHPVINSRRSSLAALLQIIHFRDIFGAMKQLCVVLFFYRLRSMSASVEIIRSHSIERKLRDEVLRYRARRSTASFRIRVESKNIRGELSCGRSVIHRNDAEVATSLISR